MSFWSDVAERLAADTEFDTQPESTSLSLDTDDMQTVTLHGTWMKMREVYSDVISEQTELPTSRTVKLSDGSLWRAARDRLLTARGQVTVNGDVGDIMIFGPDKDVPFVDEPESLRLLVTTKTPLADAPRLRDVRDAVAADVSALDDTVETDDVATVAASFDDFESNTVVSVDGTVLTTRPFDYHPDVETIEDIADTVSDTEEERQAVLDASVYGEQYIAREHEDTLDPVVVSGLEAHMHETAMSAVDVDGSFAFEGEAVRAAYASRPSDTYDVMTSITRVDHVPLGTVETSFWLHVPLAT